MHESFVCLLELHIENLLEALATLIFNPSGSSDLEDSLIDDWEIFKMVISLVKESMRLNLKDIGV